MSVLSHQSYANLNTPLWLSANAPAVAQSPFAIVDNKLIPTKQTTLSVSSNGTSDLTVANFGTGFNPVRMRMIQPNGPQQALIQFNTGNVFDSFIIGQTSTTCATDFRVAVSGVATSNLSLSNTANGGTIQSGTSVVTLSNNGIFDVGGYFRMGSLGYQYSNSGGTNGNTSTIHYFRTGGSPSATVGGMGIIGTDGALYFGTSNFTTNLSNITSYQFAIDKFGGVSTYGPNFMIHDPVTYSNFINFSNSAGVGYLDLVANSGLLYNQLRFESNATYIPRETIILGANTLNGVYCAVTSGNGMFFSDGTQQAGQYLDTNSHQYVFYTKAIVGTTIPAIVVQTNGTVTFPQGISVSTFTGTTLNGATTFNSDRTSALYIQNQPVTVSNYAPYFYSSSVFGASASLTLDFRSQLFNTGRSGTLCTEIWNNVGPSGITLPVSLVVTSGGATETLPAIPPNYILKIMMDMANLFYSVCLIPATNMTGNNFLIN